MGARQDYIMNRLVPEWMDRQQRKAAQYGDDNHSHLGIRGQYSDIWRKIGPLERALWDGEDTTGWAEGPREICMDLIGHLFLTIELMDREGSGPLNLSGVPKSPEEYVTVGEGAAALTGPRSAWCRMMVARDPDEHPHTHEVRCVRGWVPHGSPFGRRDWVEFIDGGGRGRSGPRTRHCVMESETDGTAHQHDIRCVGEVPSG